MSYYLMIIVDRQGRVVFVYSGSGTNIKGVYERWKQYDNYKDNVEQGHVKAQDLKGYHVRTMTERGYTVHLRPLLFMGHREISAKRMVAFEGQFTGVFNTFDLTGPVYEPYRTQQILIQFEEGVPYDIEYGGLNRAHQLTQGIFRGSSPPCSLIGKDCQIKSTPTSLAFTIDGVQTYMCAPCKECWRAYRRLSHDPEDWIALVEGYLNRMQNREHTNYHLPIGEVTCECFTEDDGKVRIVLNLISHVVCMKCYRCFKGEQTKKDWRDMVTEDMDDKECKVTKMATDKTGKATVHCAICSVSSAKQVLRTPGPNFFPLEM